MLLFSSAVERKNHADRVRSPSSRGSHLEAQDGVLLREKPLHGEEN